VNPEDYWQDILAPGPVTAGGYPARFDDGRLLLLPLRRLPRGGALASLIVNQASFAVVQALSADLAAKLAAFDPEMVVGLPTLGLTLAAAVAAQLRHPRYIPLGNSAKFWYRDDLSVPSSSVTTPDQAKRLYIDPRMLPLLAGRRIALIDDVISSGTSMRAAIDLLRRCGAEPAVLGTAMLQSERWRETLAGWPVVSSLRSPILDELAYKVLTAAEFAALERCEFQGAPVDVADGFIHLSTAAQLTETVARHFSGRQDLVIAAVDVVALGDALRWEPSRHGQLFPHLHGPLRPENLVAHGPLERHADGSVRPPRERAGRPVSRSGAR
jgi:uncharacterized protein (DUF952 family)/adenine/guanine phosphoribosyltransferase-like PRPP-binding protein